MRKMFSEIKKQYVKGIKHFFMQFMALTASWHVLSSSTTRITSCSGLRQYAAFGSLHCRSTLSIVECRARAYAVEDMKPAWSWVEGYDGEMQMGRGAVPTSGVIVEDTVVGASVRVGVPERGCTAAQRGGLQLQLRQTLLHLSPQSIDKPAELQPQQHNRTSCL